MSDETFNYDESNYLLPDTMEKKRTKPPGKWKICFINPISSSSLVGKSSNLPTCYNNEEYMNADSGIGEDTQSLLSRREETRNERTLSNRSSNEDQESDVTNSENDIKERSKKSSNTSKTLIENPEYMLLNAGDQIPPNLDV